MDCSVAKSASWGTQITRKISKSLRGKKPAAHRAVATELPRPWREHEPSCWGPFSWSWRHGPGINLSSHGLVSATSETTAIRHGMWLMWLMLDEVWWGLMMFDALFQTRLYLPATKKHFTWDETSQSQQAEQLGMLWLLCCGQFWYKLIRCNQPSLCFNFSGMFDFKCKQCMALAPNLRGLEAKNARSCAVARNMAPDSLRLSAVLFDPHLTARFC